MVDHQESASTALGQHNLLSTAGNNKSYRRHTNQSDMYALGGVSTFNKLASDEITTLAVALHSHLTILEESAIQAVSKTVPNTYLLVKENIQPGNCPQCVPFL